MNLIIDADAAKLAGLQIDLLQKVRVGHITLGHLEWFTGLTSDERENLLAGKKPASKPDSPPAPPTEKFSFLMDLGIVTVPAGHKHQTRLGTFRKEHGGKFYFYNDDITDENFSRPTRVLKSGDKLHVRVFRQCVGGTTTSEERLAFLATQKAVYTGAQGASLVFEQKRDQLPKGYWYTSLDQKEALPRIVGYLRVPYVSRYSGGVFKFNLGYFEEVWYDVRCLLCFCD